MTIEPDHPEVPFPLPPLRTPPQRSEPVVVPVVAVGGGDAWEQLAEQRRVLVSGPLDHDAVTELAARLMAFDGASRRDVEVVINSPGGPLGEIFPLLDVLELMRATVHATVIGAVSGTAVAVAATVTGRRRAAPNATFRLRIDDRREVGGSAGDVARAMDEMQAIRARYVAVLAAATRLGAEAISNGIDHGEAFDARRAVELGVIDAIVEPHTARRGVQA